MINESFDRISPFTDNLYDLLVFNKFSDLTKLYPAPPMQGILWMLRQNVPRVNEELLTNNIDFWGEYLLKIWQKNINPLNHRVLDKIKIIALKIKSEDKIALIKRDLERLKIYNVSIQNGLKRLENRVNAILKPAISSLQPQHEQPLPFVASCSPQDSETFKFIHQRAFSDGDLTRHFFNSCYDRRISRHVDARVLDIQIDKKKYEKEFKRVNSLFENVSSKSGLLKALETLSSPEEWEIFGKIILPYQISLLIEICLNDLTLNRKLPYIIFSLSQSKSKKRPSTELKKIELVLLGASEVQLKLIHEAFLENRITDTDWLFRFYKNRRQDFVDSSNLFSEDLDNYTGQSRDIEPDHLRWSFNDKIDHLVSHIHSKWESFRRFRKLITNVFHDHETLELLIGNEKNVSELEANYRDQVNRASSFDEDYSKARGCPYAIIHRTIFQDRLLDNDDHASEIYRSWGLNYPIDYVRGGLITSVSPETLAEWEKNPQAAHEIATQKFILNLALYAHKKYQKEEKHRAPKTLGDFQGIFLWKYLRIFNKWMLEEFLKKTNLSISMAPKQHALMQDID